MADQNFPEFPVIREPGMSILIRNPLTPENLWPALKISFHLIIKFFLSFSQALQNLSL